MIAARLALGLFLLAAPAFAVGEHIALPPAAPVVDEAHLLGATDDARLDQLVRRIKREKGVEITIFIANDTRGLALEDFSIDTATQWGLGLKKEDKGLLLTIVPSTHQMRIEVGYGLEGDLPDAFTHRVLDGGLRPYFRQGRYFDGILAGLNLLEEKVPLGLQREDFAKPADEDPPLGIGMKLFIAFIIFIYLLSWISRLRSPGYRRYGTSYWWGGGGWGGGWGGGGFGGGSGGSWGGGGGGFGGGGSSSNW